MDMDLDTDMDMDLSTVWSADTISIPGVTVENMDMAMVTMTSIVAALPAALPSPVLAQVPVLAPVLALAQVLNLPILAMKMTL